MSATFYRYIRPQRHNQKRCELVTLPHGGMCLRFEVLPEGDLFFTYARCHSTDFFNKDVARVIADDRAQTARSDNTVLEYLRRLPNSRNTDLLIWAVINRCRKVDTTGKPPIIQQYMQLEYSKIADILEKLHTDNLREERLAEAWKEAMKGLWRTAYQEQCK